MTYVLAALILLALFGAFAYVFNVGGLRARLSAVFHRG